MIHHIHLSCEKKPLKLPWLHMMWKETPQVHIHLSSGKRHVNLIFRRLPSPFLRDLGLCSDSSYRSFMWKEASKASILDIFHVERRILSQYYGHLSSGKNNGALHR